MKEHICIAVVGATGNVGRMMLQILEENNFPLKNIRALASESSTGRQISYGDRGILSVAPLDTFDFTGIDLALFSPGAKVSAIHAPRAIAQGAVVIDNTSYFRMDPNVPLVIPEINGHVLQSKRAPLIANPNCSTIQLLMALKPLHDISPIRRVVCATYQSTSGAGKKAMDELYNQTRGAFTNQTVLPQEFLKPIAFNVIPHIDEFQDNGMTKEEWKMAVETQKIMDAEIALTATCVRVPVFIGHAVAASVEFKSPISLSQAKQALKQFPGVQLLEDPKNYITPIECVGEDTVFVSRLRIDPTVPHGLNLWIVSDNIRKGAALNAIQITQRLLDCDYFTTNRGSKTKLTV